LKSKGALEDVGALDGDGVVEDVEEAKCDEPP
jgi:hypothetical protein